MSEFRAFLLSCFALCLLNVVAESETLDYKVVYRLRLVPEVVKVASKSHTTVAQKRSFMIGPLVHRYNKMMQLRRAKENQKQQKLVKSEAMETALKTMLAMGPKECAVFFDRIDNL